MDGEEWLAWADAETRQVLRFCQVKIVCLFGGGQTEPVKKGTGYDLTTVAVQGCMSHCTLVLDACYSYASPFCQNTVYRYFRGAWSPYISQQSFNGSSLLCRRDPVKAADWCSDMTEHGAFASLRVYYKSRPRFPESHLVLRPFCRMCVSSPQVAHIYPQPISNIRYY